MNNANITQTVKHLNYYSTKKFPNLFFLSNIFSHLNSMSICVYTFNASASDHLETLFYCFDHYRILKPGRSPMQAFTPQLHLRSIKSRCLIPALAYSHPWVISDITALLKGISVVVQVTGTLLQSNELTQFYWNSILKTRMSGMKNWMG